jgi:transposase
MKKVKKYSPEVRQRSVRMVLEVRKDHPSQWSAVESVASKIGCVPQPLLEWVKRHEIDAGSRDGVSTEKRERIKTLERESSNCVEQMTFFEAC